MSEVVTVDTGRLIHVPRAEFNMRPVYVGENPYKGTYKRNHEGDYHATEHEVRGMIRDQNPDGNDSMILELQNKVRKLLSLQSFYQIN